MTIDSWIQVGIGTVYLVGIIVTWIVTNKNTKKQIENQNKQNFRPYLNIDKLEVTKNNCKKDMYNIEFNKCFDCYIKGETKQRTIVGAPVEITMFLENVGIGLAQNIRIFDLDKEFKLIYKLGGKDTEYSKNDNITTLIKEKEKKKIILKVEYIREEKPKDDFPEVSDYENIVLFYEDINGNLYSNVITFEVIYIKEEKKFVFHHRNSRSIDHKNKKRYIIKDKGSALNIWLTKVKKLK